MKQENKFKIQDDQYKFPYHHLVNFDNFNNYAVMQWGFEYYAYINRVIEIVSQIKPKSLLDIGCGEGKMILELSKIMDSKTLHGIDLSEGAIFFAKAFNINNESTFECRSVSTLNSTYDIITLVETMEHVPDNEISDMVNQISKRLNPGGRVIVTVPSINFPILTKHYRHYDLDLIKNQFKGFELESVTYQVRQGGLYKILIRLSRKFCTFNFLRKLFFKIAKKYIFEAIDTTGRHLVCVFKKHE